MKVSVTIDEWIEQHIKDKVKAIAVLFNFVLLVSRTFFLFYEQKYLLEALFARSRLEQKLNG